MEQNKYPEEKPELSPVLEYIGTDWICDRIYQQYVWMLERMPAGQEKTGVNVYMLQILPEILWNALAGELAEEGRIPFSLTCIEDVESLVDEAAVNREACLDLLLNDLRKKIGKWENEKRAAERKNEPQSPADRPESGGSSREPVRKEPAQAPSGHHDPNDFSCTKTCCCGCLTMWLLGVLTAGAIWLLPQLGLDGPVFEWFVNLADNATTIICVILGILGVIGFWYYFFGSDKRP